MEIITRTGRRRRYSPSERTAVLAEADQPRVTVREVAQRHDLAKSLIYHGRTVRRTLSVKDALSVLAGAVT